MRHKLAAPKHGDAVGYAEHVGHAVTDENDRDAALLQAPDQVEHLGDLAHGNGGRRLVHQHDLGVREQRAGNRHGLALAAGHLAHQIARAGLRLQLREELTGAPVHRLVVENTDRAEAGTQFPSEKDVGRGGEIVAKREVLVDDLDPRPLRILGMVKVAVLAVQMHLARRRPEVAGDDFHQR